MSTQEIFDRLNRMGIRVSRKGFRWQARRYESTHKMARDWRARYPFQPLERYDEDFVWMAAMLLWKRLLPDRIPFEQIDARMQDGYELSGQNRMTEANDAWWQVWEWLKEKITPQRKALKALDDDFQGTQFIFNWCQDFEMELGNAGLKDPKYHRLRIRYCQEFLDTFSDIDWLMRGNFLRAEAESYWGLGEVETAEAKWEALIAANPDWAWGYVDWADCYWLFRDSPKDYDKAEAILKRALARPNLEDRTDVQERLDKLRAERAEAGR